MAFEWTPIKPQDQGTATLEIEVFELLADYFSQMRELVLEFLGRNVLLEPLDVSKGERSLNALELVRAVENNLQHLVATNVIEGMQPQVRWQGGLSDIRRLDYTDVNRWFETLELLYSLIKTLRRHELQTGVFMTGGHLELQSIGVI